MIGLGTIVNVMAVIVGAAIGVISGKAIPEKMRESLMKACGVAVAFIGIGCTLSEMLTFEDGKFGTQGIMLLILSLVIGTICGELLKIEDRLEGLGDRIKKMKMFENATTFTEGFVTSTLLICVGAMAIVGSIRDGVNGDPTMLYSKSILDFISCMVFASTLGVGVIFSALPMGIYQGGITILAAVLGEHFMTDSMVSDLSLVGSSLIFCIGVNMIFGKKIKVGNMLPSLIVPIIYGVFKMVTKM